MMWFFRRFSVLVVLGAFLTGCASYNPPVPEHEPEKPSSEVSSSEDVTQDTVAQADDADQMETDTNSESKQTADEIQSKADDIKQVSARRSGNVVILTLDQQILFELGKAKIKRSAWPTLDEIAKLIKEYPERMVMVQGHTDDLPTRTERFPSNWDLSAQRAVNVVKYIANLPGLDKSRLVAAGFGEYHPRVPNTSSKNRQLNRRVEIVLYPTDLPSVTVPVPKP